MNDAAIKAATVSGFRQGLTQCAAQLRAQAAAWRAEGAQQKAAMLEAAKRKKNAAALRREAEAHAATIEQWCGSVERIAALIDAEARTRLADENRLRSQALAAARPRGIARRLAAALRAR